MKIALIGLGYVGLPLAVEFGKKREVVGFDISRNRVNELKKCEDVTLEVSPAEMSEAIYLTFTSKLDDIQDCNIYIITVPTPIDQNKRPDLRALKGASTSVAKVLKYGDIVIYESTVYPGATEEICVPILEKESTLKFNKDFYCGYSPERINPGDKEHRLTNIKKVTSGSTDEAALKIDKLYNEIISAGTHLAKSIKVAEAAKVIENTQRDVNIALVNELAMIFNKLDIDTEAVLKAAETKWNFIPFRPGLVGGHCIGVDPYYLTYRAIEAGYKPEMILAGRRLNDHMGTYVADQVTRLMSQKRINIIDSNILVMGLTFKENCPDLRNTKVIDLIKEFKNRNCNVDIYDPWAEANKAKQEYNVSLIKSYFDIPKKYYDAVVLAVSHNQIKKLSLDKIIELCNDNYILYDIKYIFKIDEVDGRL